MTGDVIHEGKRVFAPGKSMWRVIAGLYGYFAIAALVLPFIRDASFGLSFAIAGIAATAFAVFTLILASERVQVTPTEVRARRWFRTTVVPRGVIAEVVHIRNLLVMGMPKGYLGMLDHTGTPVWRTSTEKWSPQTLDALAVTGDRIVHADDLGPEETRRRWPHLLPWSLAHPWKAFWGTFIGILVLVVLVILLAVLLT